MTTNNYYLLTIKNFPEVASAFAPENTKLAHELISELEGKVQLPFELELVKLSDEKNGLIKTSDLCGQNNIWLDYQPNSFAWPCFSERFKNLIVENLTGNESINWIKTKINSCTESRIYYIPRFEMELDVLDYDQTLFVKGTNNIIIPHFSLNKIKDFTVFNKPSSHDLWKITSGFYINEKLRKQIIKEKFIGPAFEKVRVS